MADGCVCTNRRYLLSLTLSSDDHGHLLKYKNFLQADKDISITIKKTPKNIVRYISSLSINSRLIIKTISKYGLVANKTLTAKVSSDLEFNRHFWRGVVDGDGTVGIYFRKVTNKYTAQIGLTGSFNLCNQFLLFLKMNNINTLQKVHKIKQSKAHCLSFSNILAEKIIDLLYNKSSIYLERKYKISKEIKERI